MLCTDFIYNLLALVVSGLLLCSVVTVYNLVIGIIMDQRYDFLNEYYSRCLSLFCCIRFFLPVYEIVAR